jgi:hypothetical protein
VAQEPIRVSSAAWTGLLANPAPAPAPTPQPSPSPFKVIVSSIAIAAIGAYGAWRTISTGVASCRGCDTFTATDDPGRFGLVVAVLLLGVPVGLGMLCVGIGDALRKSRKPELPAIGSGRDRTR